MLSDDASHAPEARAASAPAQLLSLFFRSADDWWRVETHALGLVYERGRGEQVLERQERAPSGREWRRFWGTVERLGVWKWADSFQADAGTEQWQLRLVHGQRRLRTGGHSAFPPLAASSPTQDFLSFCGAISQLVGILPPFP